MPNLDYIANRFPSNLGPQLNGLNSVDIQWPELVWAAITVGRKSWDDVIRYGSLSWLEIIYRSAILRANLSSTPQAGFTKTDTYKNLDPSEKSAVSYFFGLSFAKLAAQRLFGIPWLVHLDCFSDLPIRLRGNQRPDLIGENYRGEWGVFEAKGRTNRIDKKTIQKAKEQTRMLRKIDGSNPSIRVASISHFSDDTLNLHLEDPDEIAPNAIDFEILGGEDQFLKYYYQPFFSLIEGGGISHEEAIGRRTGFVEIGSRRINIVSLTEIDMVVGLDSQVQEILRLGFQERDILTYSDRRLRPQLLNQFEGILQAHHVNDDTASFLGLDGVFVDLGQSWDRVLNSRSG